MITIMKTGGRGGVVVPGVFVMTKAVQMIWIVTFMNTLLFGLYNIKKIKE
jgi:hypothetical protein